MERRTVRAYGADIVYTMILDAYLQVDKHDFSVNLSHSRSTMLAQSGDFLLNLHIAPN